MRVQSLQLRPGDRSLRHALAALLVLALVSNPPANAQPSPVAAKFAGLASQLSPPVHHFEGVTEAEAHQRAEAAEQYATLMEEKLAGRWFAALVGTRKDQRNQVLGRFDNRNGFVDFIQDHDALVEVWAYATDNAEDDDVPGRRLTATEVAALRGVEHPPPTFITLTFHDADRGEVVTGRVEFGFQAAAEAVARQLAYEQHRRLQVAARRILSARGDEGRLDARAQWHALTNAVVSGELTVVQLPPAPTGATNLFVAFEFAVDDQNNFLRVARIHREREVEREVVDGQLRLRLGGTGSTNRSIALGFRPLPLSDRLEPCPHPVAGRDAVELRVQDPQQPDPRRWNVVEFGEPELLRESSLAEFGLINAHLERRRKQLAWKRSNISLFLEPVITGLNVGSGLSGVGIPLGAAARLAYNVLVAPRLLAKVPTADEMRNLFLLLAARQRDPELRDRSPDLLTEDDLKRLRARFGQLTDAQVRETLEHLSQEDLKAMLKLARRQNIDDKYSLLVNILTDVAKVSGVGEQEVWRDIFNNPYFSLNGEININFIIAAMLGEKILTPENGYSLQDLVDGKGPAEAWLQYLAISIDVRAILNSVSRLRFRSLADKELRMPFPYAPRVDDLAAYEIRIFGYPLLMFYKRGLLKHDIAAYDHDYAYGLLGTRIVEHFPTRESMEAEVSAGRMVALGYVKVRDGKGRLRDSNLAVFAHRIPAGSHRGKTAMVIYGLKAYGEQSAVIKREVERLRKFEEALQQGGVIEQLVEGGDGPELAATAFEPALHVGDPAVEERYSQRLAALMELHRAAKRTAWGLDTTAAETERLTGIRHEASQWDRPVDESAGDPLVGVDRHLSSFRYATRADGRRQVVQITVLPSQARIEKDLVTLREGETIENARRRALGPGGAGIVFVNQVVEREGQRALGPLARDRQGAVLGAGIRTDPASVAEVLDLIERLPVTEQERIHHDSYAAAMLELDANGDGRKEAVAVTIEFPAAGEVRRQRRNPLTGQTEVRVHEHGRLRSVVSDRLIVQVNRDASGEETGSRTYVNSGSLDQPRPGELVEETQTLEIWHRPVVTDPYAPRTSRLRFNHVTGEASVETFGLFSLPVTTVTERFVVQHRFRPDGSPESDAVFENGANEADFARPELERLLHPAIGRPRYRETLRPAPPGESSGAEAGGIKTIVERVDSITGQTRRLTLDPARSGRVESEEVTDPFDGSQTYVSTTRYEYADDFHGGLVPVRAVTTSASGRQLSESRTLSFDPAARRRLSVDTDFTGAPRTNTWEGSLEQPVTIETPLRRTTQRFDRDGLGVSGATTGRLDGEEIVRFKGRFDPVGRAWLVRRDFWFRPGITSRTEVARFSLGGRLIATQSEGVVETRPVYDADGLIRSNVVSGWNAGTSAFDRRLRVESDLSWDAGASTFRVQTIVDGRPYEVFRTVTDSEGRVLADGIRELPGVRLRTALTYDGASDRVSRTEEFQNDRLRVTRTPQPERPGADGRFVVPVRVVPQWGLVSTQSFVIGVFPGRAATTIFENGDQVRVTDWFPGTAIARSSELLDRLGRVRERHTRALDDGTGTDLPLDTITRTRTGFWGTEGLLEQFAVIRGTDLEVFADSAEGRTFFDLTEARRAPLYSADLTGHQGVPVLIGGRRIPNVWSVARSVPGTARPDGEPTLTIEEVDLRPLFQHTRTTRIFDRSGQLLETRITRIANPGEAGYEHDALLAAVPVNDDVRIIRHDYQPGWLVEQAGAGPAGRTLTFSAQPPAVGVTAFPVNPAPWRDFMTAVEVSWIPSRSDSEPAAGGGRVVRRARSPRELERNPHLPGTPGIWTAWTATEVDGAGSEVFRTEEIHDAQGLPSVQRSLKQGASGEPAIKTAYQIPRMNRAQFPEALLPVGEVPTNLVARSERDLTGADFVFVQLSVTNTVEAGLHFEDAAGRRVRVGRTGGPGPERRLDFWPASSSLVRWLPDDAIPEQAAVVTSPPGLPPDERVLIVSVHDLAQAGLDVSGVESCRLVLEGAAPFRGSFSPLRQLRREGAFVAERALVRLARDSQTGAHGFRRATSAPELRRAHDEFADMGVRTVVERDNLPVAIAQPGARRSPFPPVVVFDASDPAAPRPLYELESEDGRFRKHFKVLNLGDVTQVYSVVSGFETPQLEVFNARRLAEERSPGFMAYGYDYQARVHLTKGSGPLGRPLVVLRNRIAANSFNYGGHRFAQWAGIRDPASPTASRFRYGMLHDARLQADAIRQLPSLAQALVASAELPWTGPTSAAPGPQFDLRRTRYQLLKLHVRRFGTNVTRTVSGTYLIPTAPDTDAEPYVDTAAEGGLIGLAVRLGEYGLARDLLEFYFEKSNGGDAPVHESYDASTGTALALELSFARPVQARPTAAAQLAVADAAFQLTAVTGEEQWERFGEKLITGLLERFRPPEGERAPRGITEHQYLPVRHALGLTFWPEPPRYPIGENARALQLFGRLLQQRAAPAADAGWRTRLERARTEQQAWLTQVVRPLVEETGVVPAAMFEVQDVGGETTALAPERWTSVAAWLSFLEVAEPLGVPSTVSRRWLENLARVHGVTAGGVWGLDWSLPLLRAEAISPGLTAWFSRVAAALGHDAAADRARRSLAELGTNGMFAAVRTGVSPDRAIKSEQGFALYPRKDGMGWPATYAVHRELLPTNAGPGVVSPRPAPPAAADWVQPRTDLMVFVLLTAVFYLTILLVTFLWWSFRRLRKPIADPMLNEPLVPETVMARAEERWAKRVLGMQTPAGAACTRVSNATVEQNFLLQLRLIYKLVIEWRRRENGWDEDDPRLADDASDDWLNGLDEFASAIGIYVRFVIKAGAKDGFRHDDVLAGNEDSNHIWSRMVMYLSEHCWGLLTLMRSYDAAARAEDRAGLYTNFAKLLDAIGMRQRVGAFDARVLFNFPANPMAMDLLVIQKPGVTLKKVLMEASLKLQIPFSHLARMIESYQEWKQREAPFPVHPYLIEFGKILPHFVLMGLGSLVWFNQLIGDSPIVPYLGAVVSGFALDPASWFWAGPLLLSLILTVIARFVRGYRFEGSLLQRDRPALVLDATLTMLVGKKRVSMSGVREGFGWNPELYQRTGWALRAFGYLVLGLTLLRLETPSFATFLVVKGILAMLALTEAAGVIVPLVVTGASMWLQDHVTEHPTCGAFLRFLNRLNLTATRPASPFWLSVRYYLRPSMPSGDTGTLTQAIVFYLVLNAAFFVCGAYLCLQILPLWFTETYLNASNWKLFAGALLFWNTMYLLRYGLFLLATGIASAVAAFPTQCLALAVAAIEIGLSLIAPESAWSPARNPTLAWALGITAVALVLLDRPVRAAFRRVFARRPGESARPPLLRDQLEKAGSDPEARLGIVYMSGDDLSFFKLTPALLMSRWRLLRDKLGSGGLKLVHELAGAPDDATLERLFAQLYELEKRHGVTLWHPMQLCVGTQPPRFAPALGLTLPVAAEAQRQELLQAWHVRRWLVTMMSTAGHSQDTAINLVDIALRLEREGIAGRTVFYFIQNKYDNQDNNRPSQLRYDDGELGQRDKLARLLQAVAPGCRAWSVQNWTPFGFKSAGMTGMDLVYEETMNLGTMVVLDRNATVNDLDALMEDLGRALADPNLVIIIPGRGTSNTLTDLGQGSQMIEEGHRSFLRGVMSWLGGGASEGVGTGWGNIVAVTYGRVQRALVRPLTPKQPLTSRMERGSNFAARTEGLIGFTPHAVGISEDTWAVSQAAHNLSALGGRVKFRLSTALWHKIRETWSHAEWLAAFPRWSGGFLQMMHDPIMQQINDFGPASVFAKEVRSNSGRNFLSAPFALLNSLLLPLAIILDVTPFVQILMVLWNFGFVMNQVLTLHGLNASLEGGGFLRLPALIGALASGLLATFSASMRPFAPALMVLGGLYGGFLVGLNRWLFSRVRDVILFGPQLVLHSLGQLMRQSIEFVVSGAAPTDAEHVNMAFRAWAGPREDRPLDRFPHFINLKTVVWGVGLPSLLLNLVALSNLDMFNVLLLLPSLLFSVSLLLGPFVLGPRPGRHEGWRIVPARLLGWFGALVFFTAASTLIARGGWGEVLGVALVLAMLGIGTWHGAHFVGFRFRLERLRARLDRLLSGAGVEPKNVPRIQSQLLAAGGDAAKLTQALEQGAVAEPARSPILELVQKRLAPLLKRSAQAPAVSRLRSEFNRSFALALFVFLWFFIVPVPGLFVFRAGAYTTSMSLRAILAGVCFTILVVLIGACLARLVQGLERRGHRGAGLSGRARRAFAEFQTRAGSLGALTEQEVSHLYALFTDLKVYVDQRSYAYAWRTLGLVEQALAANTTGKT